VARGPSRRELEAAWQERLKRARSLYAEKVAIHKEMLAERRGQVWPINLELDPDGRFALHLALLEESAARAEYLRILRIVNEFIGEGTVPEEESGLFLVGLETGTNLYRLSAMGDEEDQETPAEEMDGRQTSTRRAKPLKSQAPGRSPCSGQGCGRDSPHINKALDANAVTAGCTHSADGHTEPDPVIETSCWPRLAGDRAPPASQPFRWGAGGQEGGRRSLGVRPAIRNHAEHSQLLQRIEIRAAVCSELQDLEGFGPLGHPRPHRRITSSTEVSAARRVAE
jgi:hypothetical protein